MVATAELSISINDVSEEETIIINELKEICDLDEKAKGIIFTKAYFKRLKRINGLETSNITVTHSIEIISICFSLLQSFLSKFYFQSCLFSS